MNTRNKFLPFVIASLCHVSYAPAQTSTIAKPQARIVQSIDEFKTVTLNGNVHPLASASTQSIPANSGTAMEHMILFLKGDAKQESQLAQLITQQNDPKSSLYHQYLTPKDFGAQFGVAQTDLSTVIGWLQSHGFTIDQIPTGNRAVIFSGTSTQVTEAFKTEIRKYNIQGVSHLANASDPQIPAALTDAVGGIVKLHDFRHGHSITSVQPVSAAQLSTPQFTSGSRHYLAPADYATLYDIRPLYAANINGAGQTIAVLARSNIYLSDVQTFRASFGLKANDPQIVITSSDPGVLQGDSVETTLDTEWSGAVAPNATVKVIVAASTSTADGIDLSALYAVSNNVAPIITLSYGSCEAAMGTSELAFYNSLWRQAAAQGQTVMVSSGDSGAAGCDYGSVANYGPAINGLCSSPYATCVGGTQFADGANPGQFWLPGNNATYGSAISYIPEAVWNESGINGGSGLWAGGGGASITYPKPLWQSGPGVPADGKRDVPDVSLTAAGHDGYLIWLSGQLNSVGGTSAAAPSFAGIMALVDQKTNSRQGVINPILYPLAAKQATGGPAVFHDTITGNNSVPGATGFPATTGYDLATGLGSVDANIMVNNWNSASTAAPSLSLSASANSLNVKLGQTIQTTITLSATSLNSSVALAVTGVPAGVAAAFSPYLIPSPGSGVSTLNVAVSSTAAPGSYSFTLQATAGNQTARLNLALVIPAPTFTLSPAPASASVVAGTTVQASVTTTPQNGFASAVSLLALNLPAGITASFSPAAITAAAGGSSSISLAVAKTVKAGTYPITISATGGGVTQTAVITLSVSAAASCTLSANPSIATLIAGQSTSLAISCGSVQGSFSSPLSLTVSGVPVGVTARTSASTMPVGSSITLSLTSLSSTVAGNYSVSVTAISGTFSQTLTIPLTVPAPNFTVSAGTSSFNVLAGATGQLIVSTTSQNGFTAPLALSVAGLPAGVNAAFTPATLASAAGGSSALIFSVARTVRPATYPLTITASGGGITHTIPVSLVVSSAPICSLSVNPGTLSLTAGKSAGAQVTCTVSQGAFTTPLTLSLSGIPAGMTAQTSASSMAAGTSTILSVSTALSTAAGNYSLALTASASGYTQTISIPVTVTAADNFAIVPAQTSLTVKTGGTGQLSIASVLYGTFRSTVSLSISGLPAGVTASLSVPLFATPGRGVSLANFTVTSSARPGTYGLTVTGNGGGKTETAPLTLIISPNQDFSFALNASLLNIAKGGSALLITSTGNFTGGFNSTITITFSAVPPGVNFASIGATTGNNLVNVSDLFTASAYTAVGTYPVTVTASGAGITHSAVVQLTITAAGAQKK